MRLHAATFSCCIQQNTEHVRSAARSVMGRRPAEAYIIIIK